MLKGIDSVVFFVKDVHAAARWYAAILDSNVEYENEHYAFVTFEFGKFGFHPEDSKSSSGVVGQTTYWQVDSINETRSLFIQHGAKMYRGPLKTDLGQYVCILKDPFGSTIGFASNKP